MAHFQISSLNMISVFLHSLAAFLFRSKRFWGASWKSFIAFGMLFDCTWAWSTLTDSKCTEWALTKTPQARYQLQFNIQNSLPNLNEIRIKVHNCILFGLDNTAHDTDETKANVFWLFQIAYLLHLIQFLINLNTKKQMILWEMFSFITIFWIQVV